MGKTRVFVIDDNTSLVKLIKEYFDKSSNISISLDAKDGEEL